MSYICKINENTDEPKVSELGGKGYNLVKLSTGGFPVPEGFILTTHAYEVFVNKTNLKNRYESINDLNSFTLTEAEKISEEIKNLFLSSDFPTEYLKELNESISVIKSHNSNGPNLVAIRSSATTEDLGDASFAGMQDTILNIPIDIQSIKKAVLQCWASLYTPRAILYRFEKHFPVIDTLMAVVVQRMIPSEKSGVIFSRDPQTSSCEHISLDGVQGLGEALVSGLVSTDHWTIRKHYPIDKNTTELRIVETTINTQEFAFFTKPNGGTEKVFLEEKGKEPCFTEEEVYAISNYAVNIEQYYHKPMDIEFAFYQGKPFITQARPITTLFTLPEELDPLSPNFVSKYRNFICYSYEQMMLEPMTVAGLSCVYSQVKYTGVEALLIHNYPYIDYAPLLMLGDISKRIFNMYANTFEHEAFNISLDYYKSDYPFTGYTQTYKILASSMHAIFPKFGWNVLKYYYLSSGPEAAIDGLKSRLFEATNYYNQLLEEIETDNKYPTLSSKATDKYSLDYVLCEILPFFIISSFYRTKVLDLLKPYNIDESLSAKLFVGRQTNLASIMNNKIHLLHNMIELCNNDDPTFKEKIQSLVSEHNDKSIKKLMESLSESKYQSHRDLYTEYTSFMHQFGRRGPSEIDVSYPRYEDQPSLILCNILYDSGDQDGSVSPSTLEQASEEAVEEICSKLSEKDRKIFIHYLPGARLFMEYREHPKYFFVSQMTTKRKILLHIGEDMLQKHYIDEINDVFHFSVEELRDYEQGKLNMETMKPIILQRKHEFMSNKNINPPRVICTPYSAIGFLCEETKKSLSNLPTNMMKGISAYPGVIEGRAVVMTTPHDEELEQGDILVARCTDPSWTPIFSNVSGAAISIGGPLSHGSIVAREMGIPCVVSVSQLLDKVQTGMKIRIDGNQGTVEVL